MAERYALILIPGEIEPLEKADHPAGLSSAKHKGKSFGNIDTNNPSASHRERMKFAQMAKERMIGSSKPEDSDEHTPNPAVDHKGREKGQKPPHSNYSTSVSGMGSRAHGNFGKRTYIVDPKEIGSSSPESAKEHQPKNVPAPKK